jgi:hypothetical protein
MVISAAILIRRVKACNGGVPVVGEVGPSSLGRIIIAARRA